MGEGLCCQDSLARLRMADLDGTVREVVVTLFTLVGLFSCTMSLTTTLTSVLGRVVMVGWYDGQFSEDMAHGHDVFTSAQGGWTYSTIGDRRRTSLWRQMDSTDPL